MMDLNQFAVYQLKNIPENRAARFRPYSTLQERGIQVRYQDYEQVYVGHMQPGDRPEDIRKRLDRQLPRTFRGHSISVSDMLVLNHGGVATSYYVEKNGFTVIVGFIGKAPSGAFVSCGIRNFSIEGKEGSWLAFDSIIVGGREFFLMEKEAIGKRDACVVVDENGKLIVDGVYHGFNREVMQQIKDYLNPPQSVKEPVKQEKPPLGIRKKSLENGKCVCRTEIDEKHNDGSIDGNKNDCKKPKGRASVLAKLHKKQAEIARRRGQSLQ